MVARLCRPPPLELSDSTEGKPPAHQEQPTPKPDSSMEAEIQPLDREGIIRGPELDWVEPGDTLRMGRQALGEIARGLELEGLERPGEESVGEDRGVGIGGQPLRRGASLEAYGHEDL
jgi:hypothetical protein